MVIGVNAKKSGFLPIERAWMDKYCKLGYVDTFRHFYPEATDKYTWWSNRGGARQRNVGWRIDYFFINEEMTNSLQNAHIHAETLGSDHCPISLEFDLS